jgi:HTH-type transcriptional regulator, sugar sensing transcriptional regulator
MATMVQRLVDVGLTEYEAKAYLALLQLGPATGYQVAKESGVPRSTIYEILAKLVMRGAVLTQSFAEQVRYAPVPPEQFLGRLQREFRGHTDALLDGLKDLTRPAAPPGNTWNLTGRKNLFSYARQMIEQARKEVALLVGDDDELDELLPSLQEAQARGVALNVISPTPYDAGEVPVIVHPDGLGLRQAIGHGFTLVTDGRVALTGEVDRSESAVWTTNGYAVAWIRWCLKHAPAAASGRKET